MQCIVNCAMWSVDPEQGSFRPAAGGVLCGVGQPDGEAVRRRVLCGQVNVGIFVQVEAGPSVASLQSRPDAVFARSGQRPPHPQLVLLGSVEISLVITPSGRDWVARGDLIGTDNDDREEFLLLCDLDPVFMLRFDGDGTVPVTVHGVEDGGRRFSMTEYRGPEHRSIDHRMDL